ncbi:glycosyltransferase [Microbacterium sp. W1N]|uniref:glycosyltransferase n=1 Tax=Microbacterium festucae TaxID=2977531 RepID=UPI0021C24801|nr:glycosyltransferase [Microbacterium festucae]MCT9820952.1 glycosyltransferase [Microbacterium festucae]
MTRPLRVLSLYEGFFAGGARILHSDVVAGLHDGASQQHSVLALASRAVRDASVQEMTDDPRFRRLTAAGVAVHTLDRTAGDRPLDPETYSIRELLTARAALTGVDVVLSLKEQPLGLLVALQRRGWMPDVPVAACLHRSDPVHSGAALSWLAEATATGLLTATISCADATDEAYSRLGTTPGRRHVVANGIDTDRFRPAGAAERAETRRTLGIPAGAPVVVFAARFDAMKDPGLFLRAVARHLRRAPETHYVLCGAGMTPANAPLRHLIADAGLDPDDARLHPLGIRDDMPAVYGIADIVALTSAFGEASPLCLIEGAACGATPVTTAVGDAPSVVAGIGVVTPHDEQAIAEAWAAVLADRARLRVLALAARPRLDRARMVDEYRSVVGALTVAAEVAA